MSKIGTINTIGAIGAIDTIGADMPIGANGLGGAENSIEAGGLAGAARAASSPSAAKSSGADAATATAASGATASGTATATAATYTAAAPAAAVAGNAPAVSGADGQADPAGADGAPAETIDGLKLQIKKLNRLLAVQEKKFARLGSVVESSGNLASVLKAEQYKQENYLKMVMRNSPSIIILLDRELRFVYCSDVFLRLAGIPAADTATGQYASEVFKIWIGPGFANRIMGNILSACENDRTVTTEERDFFGGSAEGGAPSGGSSAEGGGASENGGGSGVYMVSVTVLHDKRSNAMDGIMLLMHDISDIRRAQWEAEQASRAKSVFLSNMSHEI
ncbi:MAG: hypothetical protein LBJ10_11315, partial [Clostridiales bacterium]|nr:hypothetical protein [Clostridiales bacterium]